MLFYTKLECMVHKYAHTLLVTSSVSAQNHTHKHARFVAPRFGWRICDGNGRVWCSFVMKLCIIWNSGTASSHRCCAWSITSPHRNQPTPRGMRTSRQTLGVCTPPLRANETWCKCIRTMCNITMMKMWGRLWCELECERAKPTSIRLFWRWDTYLSTATAASAAGMRTAVAIVSAGLTT